MRMTHLSAVVCLALLTVAPLGAQTPAAGASSNAAAGSLSGHWEGAIQAPGQQVAVEIDVTRNSQGAIAGRVSIPGQNLKGLALTNVAVAGTVVGFQIGNTPGDRTFDGTLSAEGTSIAGTYTQRGFEMPFTLSRTGDARVETTVKSAPIGKELEGRWQTSADVNGVTIRWILTLSNDADGTSHGVLLNVADGLEIPIDSISQTASRVTLDFKAVGGVYVGRVNADGTELAGTFTQGPGALDLTFRRAEGGQ